MRIICFKEKVEESESATRLLSKISQAAAARQRSNLPLVLDLTRTLSQKMLQLSPNS